MSKKEADLLIERGAKDMGFLELSLGLPDGSLHGQELLRIDISKPRSRGLRVPSGNEAGASNLWLPGGQLPAGRSEAILDLGGVPTKEFSILRIGVDQ